MRPVDVVYDVLFFVDGGCVERTRGGASGGGGGGRGSRADDGESVMLMGSSAHVHVNDVIRVVQAESDQVELEGWKKTKKMKGEEEEEEGEDITYIGFVEFQ